MDNMKGVITFRPGLFEFLEQMSMLYELIVFTCGTVQVLLELNNSTQNQLSMK